MRTKEQQKRYVEKLARHKAARKVRRAKVKRSNFLYAVAQRAWNRAQSRSKPVQELEDEKELEQRKSMGLVK